MLYITQQQLSKRKTKPVIFFFSKQKYIVCAKCKIFPAFFSANDQENDKNRLCLCSADAKYSRCTSLFHCSCQFMGNIGENKAFTKHLLLQEIN